MPSFVNIGAYIDEGTMVDTWATVGSCAQIGKNCRQFFPICAQDPTVAHVSTIVPSSM